MSSEIVTYDVTGLSYFNAVTPQAREMIINKGGSIRELTDKKDIEYEITFPEKTRMSLYRTDTHNFDGIICSIFTFYIGNIELYYHGLPFKIVTHRKDIHFEIVTSYDETIKK